MKRSSSIAALSDHPEVPDSNTNNNEWNYQEELLATTMMLVSIDEETNNHSFMQRNTQSGSMGSMASSRCSSRGSMTSSCSGWGSTTSRKSYKVDLCALGATAVDLDGSSSQQQQLQQVVGGESFTKSSSKSSIQGVTVSSAHSAPPAESGDSWGFFVDSAF